MKKLLTILLSFLFLATAYADTNYKKIRKKAEVNKPELIFPVANENIEGCIFYKNLKPSQNKVKPILDLDAPADYGLDDRYMAFLKFFDLHLNSCGAGEEFACQTTKDIILNWAKVDAAKRTGPSDEEAKHWNDTLTINLWVASPMLAGYSFVKQVIDVDAKEDKIIKEWLEKIVKKNNHLMYSKKYKNDAKTQARGKPRSAHNHALSSAIAHMQLGIMLDDDKYFRKAFRNFQDAIKSQRKDGSLPIETRRGGRAMFYQGRAMTALATIAVISENQGYDIWNVNFKKKNFHNIVKFFIDFTENNEIVFKYAKEMKAPGPAKNYKVQDLRFGSISNWAWLYSYATRFPDHENISRLKSWIPNYKNLNTYQKNLVRHYIEINKSATSKTSTWSVVRPNCFLVLKDNLNKIPKAIN